MYAAAQKGFINATDLADYLVTKGLPFRTAYKLVGELVARCIREGTVLEDLPLEEYQKLSDAFGADLYDAIRLENCVARRISQGGTGPASVEAQLQWVKEQLQ